MEEIIGNREAGASAPLRALVLSGSWLGSDSGTGHLRVH